MTRKPAGRAAHGRVPGWLLMLLCCCTSAAQERPADAPLPEVTVAGQHKGPQMWRVSSGDHAVWILGTLAPLPKRMKWDAEDVEKLLAEVQEVIPERVGWEAEPGLFPSLRLYFQWQRIQVLKNEQTLRQVLPRDLYARFSALRARYGNGPEDMERLQPLEAADRLKEEAIHRSGLTSAADVQETVLKLARKHHVPVHGMRVEIQNARGLLQQTGDLPIPRQSPCLAQVVANLDSDLGVLKARANAWALGDVQTLRSLPPVQSSESCWLAAAGASRPDIAQQMHQLWMGALLHALLTNRATLALLDIDSLLGARGSGGLLRQLRAAGYSIEGPEFSSPAH
jgi:uncharacterized protein YbaP (TraB family)